MRWGGGRASLLLRPCFLEATQLWRLYDFADFMAACFDYLKLVISGGKGRDNIGKKIFSLCNAWSVFWVSFTCPIVIIRPQTWHCLCGKIFEYCQCRLIWSPLGLGLSVTFHFVTFTVSMPVVPVSCCQERLQKTENVQAGKYKQLQLGFAIFLNNLFIFCGLQITCPTTCLL